MKKSKFPHGEEKRLVKILNFYTHKVLKKLKNTEDFEEFSSDNSKEDKEKIINDLKKVVLGTHKKIFESWRTMTDEELKTGDLKGSKFWIRENYKRINNMDETIKDKLKKIKTEEYDRLLKSFNDPLDKRLTKILTNKNLSKTDVNKVLTELKGFYNPSQEIKNLINKLERYGKVNKNEAALLQDWSNRRNELWARNEVGTRYADELRSILNANDIEHYIWRTMEDNRVRMEHVEKDGKIFNINEGILPGQDFGCRCWAESIKGGKNGNRE